MDGKSLLDELSKRILKRNGNKSITDAALAKAIGVTQPNIALWRKNKTITPRQVVNLIEIAEKRGAASLIAQAITPIIEFFYIDPVESKQGARWELFSEKANSKGSVHPYLAGLKSRLERTHGIYIFHDSRGRAIYAGKARVQMLWKEINDAFNRDRGEVQSIKRVAHPKNRINFNHAEDGKRKITNEPVALHEIASYISAYEVADKLIGPLEALIVRSFANDLLNIKMENFSPKF